MEPSFFWVHNVAAFKVGRKGTYANSRSSKYFHDNIPAVFDTGSPLIYLPNCKNFHIYPIAIGVEFISRLLRGKLYKEHKGLFLVTCDTSVFDPVSLFMSDYWFEISPETYIVNVTSKPYNFSDLRESSSLCFRFPN